jgi:phosphatidylinositol dimannoside acyltransferase
VKRFALDGAFWRAAARAGAAYGPEWFVRYSPPLIGLAACALARGPRDQVVRNLRRIHGERPAVREATDVARTFATYASCLAEILGAGSPRARMPRALITGERHFFDARRDGRGVIFATAHTAGWETVGPLLSRDHDLRLMIAEERERDAAARAIQDEARRTTGLLVAHVGEDPLSALPLAHHLRAGGVVALQIDRTPPRMRTRPVRLFGTAGAIPEGPLRLSMVTGAPVLPIFAARTGYREYEVVSYPPVRLSRRATDGELDAAAQALADAMESFVRTRSTQWFHFQGGG